MIGARLKDGAPAHQPPCLMGVVLVRLGSHEFALDIRSVREIRGWSPPTPLPRAPAFVRGMSDLRGAVIPIIDLSARLGLPAIEAQATSVVVVVTIRDRLVGLLVDGVCDLLDIDQDRLQATPETGSRAPGEIIQGIFDIDGRIFSLLDLQSVIPAELAAEPTALAS